MDTCPQYALVQTSLSYHVTTSRTKEQIKRSKSLKAWVILWLLLLLLLLLLLSPLCRVFLTIYLKKNYISRVYSVAAVLYLKFMLHVMLFYP